MKTLRRFGWIAAVALATSSASAGLYFNDNFSLFANGDLVGQHGWTQLGTAATLPLQIVGGKLVVPAGQSADNQDAWRSLGTQVQAPGSGTASLYVGMRISVDLATPASKSPSYFFGMSTNAVDATGFVNQRLSTTNDLASGANNFRYVGRVTGQSGAPWSLGSVLTQGVQYTVLMEANLTAGAQNDTMRLFINPTSTDLNSQAADLVASLTAGGNGTDPTGLGTVIISQFANATTANTGFSIAQIVAGDNAAQVLQAIPEPSVMGLGTLGALVLVLRRRR